MDLRTRISAAVAVCATLMLSTLACGGRAPASPTAAGLAQIGASAAPASAVTSITTTWECFAARSVGLFASQECARATSVGSGIIGPTAVASNRLVAAADRDILSASVNGSTVTLTWSAPPSDPVTSYVVQAGSTPGASDLANFDTGNTATTLTVTNVPAGTYYVRLRFRNAAGLSDPTNEVIVTVGGSGPPTACGGRTPSAPLGLTFNVSGTTVTLSWTPPSGNCTASSYVLQAGSASGSSNLANFNTGSASTTYTATAVPAGTYFVRAIAVNANGSSDASNEVIVTVGGAAPPGGSLTGLWQGTITPRLSSSVQVDFTQAGTSLTGVVRNRAAGQAITFQLTQSADPTIYTGDLVFEGTGGSACGAGAQTGSLQVSAGSTTMAGSFTRAASGSCPAQTNQVQLTKQ